jgi:hypothetical protein
MSSEYSAACKANVQDNLADIILCEPETQLVRMSGWNQFYLHFSNDKLFLYVTGEGGDDNWGRIFFIRLMQIKELLYLLIL